MQGGLAPVIDPLPHQLTAEECSAAASRLELHQAKHAAHKAYLAATRALDLLDETADETWVAHALAAKEHAWKLYEALVLETEW